MKALLAKNANMKKRFISWAQNTSPIMKPLDAARKKIVHSAADSGSKWKQNLADRTVGSRSALGNIRKLDTAFSRKLGLLPKPKVKVTETKMSMSDFNKKADYQATVNSARRKRGYTTRAGKRKLYRVPRPRIAKVSFR